MWFNFSVILLDATAQAELVKNNEVKPLELVDAAIERALSATAPPCWMPPAVRIWAIPTGPRHGSGRLSKKSVPLFWNDDNLPSGTHFIGRFGDEATLFRLAAQLEAARPWADRRPPVSG